MVRMAHEFDWALYFALLLPFFSMALLFASEVKSANARSSGKDLSMARPSRHQQSPDLRKMMIDLSLSMKSLSMHKFKSYYTRQALRPPKVIQQESCPVCLEPMDDYAELCYCAGGCQEAVHSRCFDLWTMKRNDAICVTCHARNSMFDYEEAVFLGKAHNQYKF